MFVKYCALFVLLVVMVLMSVATCHAAPNTFSLMFKFPERDETDIARINEVLSRLPLSSINIDTSSGEIDGYICTTKHYDKDENLTGTTYRYGFDSLILECEMNNDGDADFYQIDTKAYSRSEMKDSKMFRELWLKEHPGRVMRVMMEIEFNSSNAAGFIVLHHEKK